MSTRTNGRTGHHRSVQARYAMKMAGFKRPIPKPPLQSKAELRRIAGEAIQKWLSDHADRPPNT